MHWQIHFNLDAMYLQMMSLKLTFEKENIESLAYTFSKFIKTKTNVQMIVITR